MAKLTGWFPGDIDPVRAGVYEVERSVMNDYPSKSWLRWDGNEWLHTNHSSLRRFPHSYACMTKNDKWRGINKPKGTK